MHVHTTQRALFVRLCTWLTWIAGAGSVLACIVAAVNVSNALAFEDVTLHLADLSTLHFTLCAVMFLIGAYACGALALLGACLTRRIRRQHPAA